MGVAGRAAGRVGPQAMISRVRCSLALGDLALSPVRGAGGFWLGRERDDTPIVRLYGLARGRDRRAGAQRGRQHRRERRLAAAAGLSGRFRVVLVDDDSNDGTAEVARRAAAALGERTGSRSCRARRCRGLDRQALGGEAGHRGRAERAAPPKYLLLTDADIVHAPDALRWLVAHAEAERLVLTSLMAQAALRELRRARAHPGLHLLLPDALSVRLGEPRRTARRRRAAGGCMLVRADALRAAGGIEVDPRRADRRLRARAQA